MSRRIEVELTSRRDDGTWTWRAAGARQPKGELDGSLLHDGAAVGDVLRVEAEFDIDGIVVTAVLSAPPARKEPKRLEVIGPPPKPEPSFAELAERAERRGGRRDRKREGGRRPEAGDRRDRGPRPDRPRRPAPEPRPQPKRLRPGRAHRQAVLAELPEAERPIAEQALRGGIAAVRQAVDKQNEEHRAAQRPEVAAEPLVAIAERLLPRLRAAEWRDRAEAALASLDELDLRDLRSVVAAADGAARDQESRAVAEQLREGLARRAEAEQRQWLDDLQAAVREERVVRALRLSSRPPKAGSPLPPEVATALVQLTSAHLTADLDQDRWVTVVEALAYSPVRSQVAPASLPAEPGDALRAAVQAVADRLPELATALGLDPSAPAPRARNRRRRAGGPGGGAAGGRGGAKPAAAPEPEAAEPDVTAEPEPTPELAPVDEGPSAPEVEAEEAHQVQG